MSDKEGRAWDAYLALAETASWIDRELRAPLDVFGIAASEFRLLVRLYRDGPLTLGEVAARLVRSRQGVRQTVDRAEEFGWVRLTAKRLPPMKLRASQLPKARRGRARAGVRVVEASLTVEGRRLIAEVLPKQAGIVRVLMEAVDARELASLTRICQKLREGNLLSRVRFIAGVANLQEAESAAIGETEADGG